MVKEGCTQKQILEALRRIHGNEALSQSSVQRWVCRIQNEGDNIRDKPKSGAPLLRAQKVPLIRQLLQGDRRSSVRELARASGLSVGSTHKVLRKDLDLKKRPAKWIPHLLTAPQQARHLALSRQCLALMRRCRNPVSHLVAEDESWVFTWDPDSRRASCEWLRTNEERPTKVRMERADAKVMLVVFFDREGMIYWEFVPNGRGIGRILYQQILERFRQCLRRCRPRLWHSVGTDSWRLLHDGAPAHRADSTVRYLDYHGITTMPHPGYSPGLNPCDYWFFDKMKKAIKGIRIEDVDSLKLAVDASIGAITAREFADAMDRYPVRLRRCVAAGGDYFE